MSTDIVPITAGQIGKAQELLAAALRKSNLPSKETQQIFESQGSALVDEWIASLRRRVEAISNLVVRKARVNRGRTPQEALDATGRTQYTDRGIVDAMPKGEGDEVEVVFFRLGYLIGDDDLESEYKSRRLKPADPLSLAAVNEADPVFADQRHNCTHWKNSDGRWCYAAFDRWGVVRKVNVLQSGLGWHGYWWFAGLRNK